MRKKEEKRNEEVPMMNDRKTVKEHLSEIQKGGTQSEYHDSVLGDHKGSPLLCVKHAILRTIHLEDSVAATRCRTECAWHLAMFRLPAESVQPGVGNDGVAGRVWMNRFRAKGFG